MANRQILDERNCNHAAHHAFGPGACPECNPETSVSKAEIKDAQPQATLRGKLTDEVWREYDFGGRVYRINSPQELYFRNGGSTHRVIDLNGIVHCVPAPGVNGCVLRWKVADGLPAVRF